MSTVWCRRRAVWLRALVTMGLTALLTAQAAATSPHTAGAARSSESAGTPDSTEMKPLASIAVAASMPDSVGDPSRADQSSGVVHVYYFHRTIRCETCLKFESYAHEALLADYADELASGRVTWSVLNFEEEENAEPVDRYDIFESSLVVSSVRDSTEVAWEKLEAIWGLVSDKDAYMEYVSAEVDTAERALVDGGAGHDESAVPLHR